MSEPWNDIVENMVIEIEYTSVLYLDTQIPTAKCRKYIIRT